jgi:hypothetical protein
MAARRRALPLIVATVFVVIGGLVVVFTNAGPASAGVTTNVTMADAFIASDLPTKVQNGSSVSLDASPARYGYWKFNVTISPGQQLSSAVFKCWDLSTSAAGLSLWTAASSWSETTVTWNNAPKANFGLPPVGRSGPVKARAYLSADVTAAITGSGTYTLVGRTSSSNQWSCASKENSAKRPAQLVVTTVPIPPPTTTTAAPPTTPPTTAPTTTPPTTAPTTTPPTTAPTTTPPTTAPTTTPTTNPPTTTTPTTAPTTTPTATPPPHPDIGLPARGTFSYPWFPEAWNQNGINPATHYTPTLGFYRSVDVMTQQVQALVYGGFRFDVSSWWGQGSKEDARFQPMLNAAHGTPLAIAPYYEAEGNPVSGVTGSPNPASAQITADLNYLAANYINDPNYLWVAGKPAIFVYGDGGDGCSMADRWSAANAAAATQFYVVLKVFAGYSSCASQPDNWHQYGPAAAEDLQGKHAIAISPGYFKYDTSTALLARDLSRWHTEVTDLNCSSADLKLVTTFNEWGEGTAVESANEWSSASGQGAYLDELHNNTTCAAGP